MRREPPVPDDDWPHVEQLPGKVTGKIAKGPNAHNASPGDGPSEDPVDLVQVRGRSSGSHGAKGRRLRRDYRGGKAMAARTESRRHRTTHRPSSFRVLNRAEPHIPQKGADGSLDCASSGLRWDICLLDLPFQ
jgi:hypothetical protein